MLESIHFFNMFFFIDQSKHQTAWQDRPVHKSVSYWHIWPEGITGDIGQSVDLAEHADKNHNPW